MYQNFFVHLSVNGHLGSFHIQGTANNVAMNIRIQVSFFFQLLFSQGICPAVVLLGYMGVLVLVFFFFFFF